MVDTREKFQYEASSYYKVESCRSSLCIMSMNKTVIDDDCLNCNQYVKKHDFLQKSPPGEVIPGVIEWIETQAALNAGRVPL